MTDNIDENSSAITYPSDFTIKIIMKNASDSKPILLSIIQGHSKTFNEDSITSKLSKDSNYISFSAMVHATSKAQLDDIYKELSSSTEVLMAL